MSRIGSKAISIPDGVSLGVDGQVVSAKGPKGELQVSLVGDVMVALEEGQLTVTPRDASKRARARWGMSRTLVQNIVDGVREGFEKKLSLHGVGYRAQLQGKTLKLSLGLSHDVVFEAPEGVNLACPSQTEIVVSGIDKQKVGQVAAEIRRFRPPEPYKGKGVRYVDEYVRRKEGKKK